MIVIFMLIGQFAYGIWFASTVVSRLGNVEIAITTEKRDRERSSDEAKKDRERLWSNIGDMNDRQQSLDSHIATIDERTKSISNQVDRLVEFLIGQYGRPNKTNYGHTSK